MGLLSLLFDDTPPSEVALRSRLARVERKIDAMMAALGIDLPQDDIDDLRELVARDRKIEAIKVYRERTGAGLADAKAFVDSLG